MFIVPNVYQSEVIVIKLRQAVFIVPMYVKASYSHRGKTKQCL